MKAPLQPVTGLAERLACGHYVQLKRAFVSTRTGGPWSGQAKVWVHARRRCADCAATPEQTERQASAVVERLEAVSAALDDYLRRLEARP